MVDRNTEMKARLGLAAALLVAAVAPASLARADEADHALLSRYPGSTVTSKTAKEFDSYTLVESLEVDGMKFGGRPLEGQVTRLVYQNPKERSTLEIFRNYQTALEGAGAKVLFTCEQDTCGPGFVRSAWNRFNGLFAASDGDPRYLAAEVRQGETTAYVAVMVGRARTQVDVVEIRAMDTGLIAVDPAALAQGIERDGSVRIYGILFDHDKSDIKPESKPALDAIAQLLREQPKLSIFVVGHTDGTGGFDHNMKLSRDRAAAVTRALTGDYAIAAARLAPHGVGPLAPVASNATEAGRKENRRVELVAR